MSDRWERRKHDKEIEKIIVKAKRDMMDWMKTIEFEPSEWEIKVWQSGYIYGLNRGAGAKNESNN